MESENCSVQPPVSNQPQDHMNIIFIGHVDAGKSTIGGQILVLTDMISARTLEKYEKESKELNRASWYLSWALDTFAEERSKGITVECGKATFSTPHRRFTIIDAPGHKNFVPSMIEGSSQADVALLIISARKGEFETGFERGGQTREHALLIRSSGIQRIIVVVNKMDDPSVGWSKARYDEIVERILPFLKKSGWASSSIYFIPVSGLTGGNIKESVGESCPWWHGPSLLSLLDSMPPIERHASDMFLMSINNKLKDMGTLVFGKIETGCVSLGTMLYLSPLKKVCEVTGIYDRDVEMPKATAGDNVRIKLKNVEEEEISIGFVLSGAPLSSVQRFKAQIIVDNIRNIISSGYRSIMHVHSAVVEVQIVEILYKINKDTKQKVAKGNAVRFLRKGDVAGVVIEVYGALCALSYAECAAFGSFSLRDEGRTVAQGRVIEILQYSE